MSCIVTGHNEKNLVKVAKVESELSETGFSKTARNRSIVSSSLAISSFMESSSLIQ